MGRMPTPGMRIQSIRFSEEVWTEIQDEAHHQGVSASQYVREAAIARVWFEKARRGGQVADGVQEYLDAARARDGDGD